MCLKFPYNFQQVSWKELLFGANFGGNKIIKKFTRHICSLIHFICVPRAAVIDEQKKTFPEKLTYMINFIQTQHTKQSQHNTSTIK